ncbi:hypothetical protein BO82DRAFT_379613 [Aspergillus uvarum CBS 121591]|uniref:BTB domain-containing protein n=1 Tax=Aspergillus uvarum CBS 121591 TaxID=1448315 RepID=A0A319BVK9_9EURO|nr:hypothetical protein BO82DRAFT_379613 [Aspergillus uvarum CBS 121591]PYH75380.1 hypothetical protein BO82DRAFT_379613 [Aspergillus uvarum CBS 121591]
MKDLVRNSQYLNPKYSDLSIRCGDEVFPAHQNIIGPQSKYFEVTCDSSFKESYGEIILEDRDPGPVKKALEFLYTGDYTYDGSSNAQAFFHAQMYAQDSFNSSVIEVYSFTGEYDHLENSIFCDNILESVPSFMLDVCISALDKCAT